MIAGLPLGGYLSQVDDTGRLLREEKAANSRQASVILERPGSVADA